MSKDTSSCLAFYNEQGYLFLPGLLTFQECELLRAQLLSLFSQNLPNRIMEKDGVTVRSVYGVHTDNEVMSRVARHPHILEPAMQIIANAVYIHQFKINKKAAFKGDIWEWHQDYIFWLKEDGIPGADLTNGVIFLDEVNEFNGPLLLLPGSQKEHVIEILARQSFSLDAAANSA
jgi:ectoine hydroxylase